ncbi:patatin-like phospholipase family protein [Chitinimonas lacunae]|uniref:Patatin-like phospholipase family protein n=1 Tax=Chitinimonas lacunae TaxID=1963018 RepID=A0ABV8MQM3_9NEIS
MEAPREHVPAGKKALLISGGAPNATLMAGALVAFIDQGVEFDVVSTSGAGALIGLLYQAPVGGDPRKALSQTVNMGISDLIYRALPINYKVFMKPGTGAELYRKLLAMNPFARELQEQLGDNQAERLLNDWLQLWWQTLSPSNLGPQSLGLCAHVPFASTVIDFAAIKQVKPYFYINAFNVSKGQMEIWTKEELSLDHFLAALSFPLIYPPYQIGEDYYIEGAAIDTINFRALVSDNPAEPGLHTDLDTLVVFDILGSDKLIQKPRDLYDAWVRSIITPLVEISRDDIKLFEYQYNLNPDGTPKRRLLKVPLMADIPADHWPKVLDWSSSNLELLYKVGYNAGLKFCHEHADALNIEFNGRIPPMQLS